MVSSFSAHHSYKIYTLICFLKTAQPISVRSTGAEFATKKSLVEHEQSDCGRNPFYSCEVCGSRFCTRLQYNKHMKNHADGAVARETFTCETCGRVLKNKHILRIHMQTHTGENPFKCSHCGKAFRTSADHKRHELAHEGIKLYECAGCKDRFTCNSNLQKHRHVRKDTCGLAPLQSLRVLMS